MGADDAAAVAVLLRQAQWALDDAAHRIPEDRLDGEAHHELAEALERLATVLRSRADPCTAIEQPSG